MKLTSILASILIATLAPAADNLSRVGLYAGRQSKPVELGDVLLRGVTYPKARGRCNLDGTVNVLSAKNSATMSWEKVPWDLQRKLQDHRDEVANIIRKEARFFKSPGSLGVIWGVGMPVKEKTICTSVLKFEHGGHTIIAHFVGAGAVMFDVERAAGWTPESTEAVLTSLDPAQVWRWNEATSRWDGSGGSRASMAGPRLRVLSSTYLRMIEGTATSKETMGI
jgi:hypothetical protein